MKSAFLVLNMAILGMFVFPLHAQTPRQNAGNRSSVQFELPLGDIEISFVESSAGMVLMARCQDVTVKSQRLYLGDGRTAALFEATMDGFMTPNGKIDASAIALKKGDSLTVPKGKSERWGANRGEVYLKVTAIEFKVSE